MTRTKENSKTAREKEKLERQREKKRDCERRRRARIKADLTVYEAFKEKDRARYADKKAKSQVKLVGGMTKRELRMQRKEWKERKARSRLEEKRRESQLNESLLDDEQENTLETENFLRLTSGLSVQNSPSSSLYDTPSRQKQKGLKIARINREKNNLIIKTREKKLKNIRLKMRALRVQLLRATKKKDNVITKKRSRNKNIFKKQEKTKVLRSLVRQFLERDDNSRMCPGKKDCVSKKKIKIQKRYLSDTMQNLYKKFLAEHKPNTISFATFCRIRPRWIVSRKIVERDSCLCVIHENTQLMFGRLKYLNIISDQTLRECCKTVVCDMKSETCMLRQCEVCKVKIPNMNEFDDSVETTYKLWTVKKENRLIRGEVKEVRRTVKAEVSISKKTLLSNFLDVLDKFLVHQHKITHQYIATNSLKNNLSVGEIFIQVDFSENYCCKYAAEIQAVHFGASRQQISLHTGVYYYKCPDTQELKSKSFCTLSDCLRHDACAISAHMQKMIDQIHFAHPIKVIQVLSDGPTAQYINKKAFYLFTQYLTQRYGLRIATWNFSEAGHGKGPMDGVGAVIKRTADRIVAQGEDIPDFSTLIKSVKTNTTNVMISVVTEEEIEDIDKLLSDQGKCIPETLKIHQITWDSMNPRRIWLRELTCVTCKPGDMCPHYSLKKSFFDFDFNPGLGIELQSLQNQENIPGPSSIDEIDENDVPKSRENENVGLTSKGDPHYILVSGSDENQPCNSQSAILKEGMWVVVRFLTKKTEKHFVGQVIGFDGVEPKIKFTKKKKTTKDITFLWIEPEDIFPVLRDDVMAVLVELTPGRRGELLFNSSEVENYKNIQ